MPILKSVHCSIAPQTPCPAGASETDIPNVGGNTDLNCNQNNGLAGRKDRHDPIGYRLDGGEPVLAFGKEHVNVGHYSACGQL